MADKPISRAAKALSAFRADLPTFPSLCTAAPGNPTTAWPEYTQDGLGQLDVSDFTADVGRNSSPGAALCGRLAWLGVTLDEQANPSGGPRISTSDKRRVGLDHPHQRRTDARAAHAGAQFPAMEDLRVGGAAKCRDLNA